MRINPAWRFLAFTFWTAFVNTGWTQPLTVTTLAGQFHHNGYVNGVGTNAQFHGLNDFSDLAADTNGFLYVVDGNAIRRISADALVVTLAGNPVQAGYVDATGSDARFSSPAGIAADANGNVYVADQGNYVIRKISPEGVVSTVAGTGTPGYVDSAAGTPKFQIPTSVALDSAGNIYVADYTTLRKITPAGVVSTLAGIQTPGFDDGTGASARFISPFFLAAKADGNIYVAMAWVIRKVTLDGTVSTFAGDYLTHTDIDGIGTNAGFAGAYSIALDNAGGLYVSDSQAGTIRYVTSAGVVSTVAGSINRFPYPASNDGVGTNAYFAQPLGIAVDAFGNVDVVDGLEYTVLQGVSPSLPPIGSFSESPGVAPIRSNNPWHFTADYSTLVSDLRLRVQSTTTTNNEASWTDLPNGGGMTLRDTTWTLDTINVPVGTRYFRVIASAPGYTSAVSAPAGPETVLEGIAPFGPFTWETSYPLETGVPWKFTITEASLIPDLSLRVQSSPTDDLNSWTDLPGGGQMGHSGAIWTLTTTNLPVGKRFFRVLASASTYVDRVSTSLPFVIKDPLPSVTKSFSTGGAVRSLDALLEPDPQTVYFQAVQAAVVKFGCSNNAQYNAAVNFAGEQYASAVLQIEADQHVGILAANMGQNSTLLLKGVITGDVSLIGQDGNGVISNDGGTITQDIATAALIGQDGNGLIGQDGNGLIGQDGNGLIGQDGNGLIGQDGNGLIGQDGNGLIGQDGNGLIGQDGNGLARNDGGLSSARHDLLGPSPRTVASIQPAFTGLMTINGNFSQFAGTTLAIGIAGTNTVGDGAQQFDQLVVKGQANLLGGTIAFELFNPDNQTNRANVFQPPDGATFDVVVASNIVVNALHVRGPVWGDGLFFKGSVVTRADGLQAVRLVATHTPPHIFIQNADSGLRLVYGTNYTGYSIQSSPAFSSPNWTTISTGTNVVTVNPTNATQFFRLTKP